MRESWAGLINQLDDPDDFVLPEGEQLGIVDHFQIDGRGHILFAIGLEVVPVPRIP